MIRLTHRRCRHEIEGLADAAARQTENAQGLAEDLMAAEHAMDEVRVACGSVEYATTEADIPDVLRSRLVDAAELPAVLDRLDEAQENAARLAREHTEQVERALRAAHEEGRLARTWALLAGAGMSWRVSADLVDLVRATRIITWTNEHRWRCPTSGCDRSGQVIVWHHEHPDQAAHACPCGQVWAAPASEVERTEGEIERRPWNATPDPMPLQQRPAHVLDAFDRAVPSPARLRDRVLVAVPA